MPTRACRTLQALLANGADTNAAGPDSELPLVLAVQQSLADPAAGLGTVQARAGRAGVVQRAWRPAPARPAPHRRRAPLGEVPAGGATPAQALLEHGAADLRDAQGLSAADLARQAGSPALEALLAEYGAAAAPATEAPAADVP